MSKVKYILTYEKWSEHPISLADANYKEFEIEVPQEWGMPKLTSIGYEHENTDRVADGVEAFYHHSDINNLIGKLLTYVDATFTDSQQRKAHKDIVNKTIYDWTAEIYSRAWDQQKWAKIERTEPIK